MRTNSVAPPSRMVARFIACLLIAAACPFLAGCSSLSSADQDQLANYQQRAKLFWEGGKYGQALIMIEKGLELEPDDYNLRNLQASIYLKQSPSSQGTDHRLLDRATAIFEDVYDTRSDAYHNPALLFNFALALQKQARRHAGEATRLAAQIERGLVDDADEARDTVTEDRELAARNYGRAKQLLEHLVDRGEVLRLAHYHLALAARDTGDHDALMKHSKAYFEQVQRAHELTEQRIAATVEPGYELEQKRQRASLMREELGARTLMSEYFYARGQFKEALPMLNRILEIDPSRSSDYYNRGRVLLNLGENEQARSDFRKFLATTDLPATSEKAMFAAAQITK